MENTILDSADTQFICATTTSENCAATDQTDAGKTTTHTKNDHVRKSLDRYAVRWVPVDQITPSPENDSIYGGLSFANDPGLFTLATSIQRLGLEEPLILTADGYILSGHRRFFAIKQLGWTEAPARFSTVSRADNSDYYRLLTQYNPQRVKSVASTLAESLLNSEEDEDPTLSWIEFRKAKSDVVVARMVVKGDKFTKDVGPRQWEFLEAAQKAIEELRDYWPLSIRQIHYRLLNHPPLTQATKDRSEDWRYKNTMECYKKTSNLLVSARYHGHVPWEAIADETRETTTYSGFDNTREFIEQETKNFLAGYHRDKQEGQPNHIELIVEKNTLLNIVRSISEQFYVPLTPLRGYGGPSVWKDIEIRWREAVSKSTSPIKPKCILVIVSDHDPEGLSLADDAVRSLRDGHGVDVVAVRAGITLEQIEKYKLPSNPAKEKSARFAEYVKRTGTTATWECEALDPGVLRQAVYDALKSVMDLDQLNAVQERQAAEKKELAAIRQQLSPMIIDLIEEGEL